MKIALSIVIDDKQVAVENVAHLAAGKDGKVDPMTVQWLIYGMLQDATLRLKVGSSAPQQPAAPAPETAPAAEAPLQ